jgi:ATP-dependent 26S proteasome regulatory subunit
MLRKERNRSKKMNKIEIEVANFQLLRNKIIPWADLSGLDPIKAHVIEIALKHLPETKPENIYILEDFSCCSDFFALFELCASVGLIPYDNHGMPDMPYRSMVLYSYKYREGFYFLYSNHHFEGEHLKLGIAFFVVQSPNDIVDTVLDAVRRFSEQRKRMREKRQTENKRYAERIMLKDMLLKDIFEDVQLFIDRRDKYKELGLPWKRGYLFHGPPGNGKTLTLRAIAKHFGLPRHDALEFVDKRGNIELPLLKDSADIPVAADGFSVSNLLNDLYPEARIPDIYYLEDMEKVVSYQSSNTDNPVLTLSSILRALDGVDEIDGVIFIGTTNHLDTLSQAIVARPGRFDRIFEFGYPDNDQITRFLDYHELVVDGIERNEIVKEFAGMSMAFVEEFVKICKLKCMSTKIKKDVAENVMAEIEKHNQLRKDLPSEVGFGSTKG